jgi:hypothetical protein
MLDARFLFDAYNPGFDDGEANDTNDTNVTNVTNVGEHRDKPI